MIYRETEDDYRFDVDYYTSISLPDPQLAPVNIYIVVFLDTYLDIDAEPFWEFKDALIFAQEWLAEQGIENYDCLPSDSADVAYLIRYKTEEYITIFKKTLR